MEKRVNIMGSEVVEGFRCKPVDRDPNRPLLHFRHQIFLCTGHRCAGRGDGEALANTLRSLAEQTGLDRGEHRIKITRSNCFGACRFRQVSVIYENGGTGANNCVWLKHSQLLDVDGWKEIFQHLSEDIPLKDSRFAGQLIPLASVDMTDGSDGPAP